MIQDLIIIYIYFASIMCIALSLKILLPIIFDIITKYDDNSPYDLLGNLVGGGIK